MSGHPGTSPDSRLTAGELALIWLAAPALRTVAPFVHCGRRIGAELMACRKQDLASTTAINIGNSICQQLQKQRRPRKSRRGGLECRLRRRTSRVAVRNLVLVENGQAVGRTVGAGNRRGTDQDCYRNQRREQRFHGPVSRRESTAVRSGMGGKFRMSCEPPENSTATAKAISKS